MNLTPNTSLTELIESHPFLEQYLGGYGPRSSVLRSKEAISALGENATLRRAAAIGGVDLDKFMSHLAKQISGATGGRVSISGFGRSHFKESAARMRTLEEAFVCFKAGKDIETAQQRIIDIAEDVEPHEIAAVEHTLAYMGIPFEELQRLCDMHVGSICELLNRSDSIEVLSGHPINTYFKENEKIESLANLLIRLGEDLKGSTDEEDIELCFVEIDNTLTNLKGVETHYIRKENHLFPPFEQHGLKKPPHVTWDLHDEVRSHLQEAESAVSKRDKKLVLSVVSKLHDTVIDLVEKENRIVFPLALNTLTSKEWAAIRECDDKLGYSWVTPGEEWVPSTESTLPPAPEESTANVKRKDAFALDAGSLTPEQVDLLMGHLPVDITYVDEYDEVKYFNNNAERVFPRGSQAIGRKVQQCHPVKSLHLVNRILSEFRRGISSAAEFWFGMKGKFIHISYIAVRDDKENYRGCLELAQDVTEIKKLEGTKRLID